MLSDFPQVTLSTQGPEHKAHNWDQSVELFIPVSMAGLSLSLGAQCYLLHLSIFKLNSLPGHCNNPGSWQIPSRVPTLPSAPSLASHFWQLEISLSRFWAHLWISYFFISGVSGELSQLSQLATLTRSFLWNLRGTNPWAILFPQPLTGCPSSHLPLYPSAIRAIKCLYSKTNNHNLSTGAKA